jgi:cold shock CspA family protein
MGDGVVGLTRESTVPQGSVREYDVETQTGTIASDDDETLWPIDPVAMQQGMFRFFRTGQRVTFDIVVEDGEQRVRNLRIGLA